MAGVRTYSPDRVKVTYGGNTIKGMADGTFITVSQITDGITSQAGADGEVARAMSADRRMRVVLTLQQTAPSNEALSTAYDADQLSGGEVPLPLSITDLRGASLFASGAAWIVKKADSGFAKEVGTREWTLETAAAAYTVGGN